MESFLFFDTIKAAKDQRKERCRWMELKIGKRIQDLRKQKGLTQEQVAAALNISAAAVSKWETDTTYPDITILNPLARLLGVSVDVLLDFQEQMTEEECMKRMEKADTLFSTRNWEEGQQYCEELLKEFPTDLFLKFRVASTYMQYAGASLQEEILKQQMERSITLFEESTASENAEISETAWYVLSGLYCMNEEYEKGHRCIGVPVYDYRGEIVAAVSVSGEKHVLTDERMPEIAEYLMEKAGQLSRDMGYTG